jgi:hypothetical protein
LRAVGKTSDFERAALLHACFREFKYIVIVSANRRPLVIQRLAAIKTRDRDQPRVPAGLRHLRGNLWQEGLIALPNGVAIQALGRDTSVTGMKYLDTRPDALMVDDVKDPEEVRFDVERQGSPDRLLKTLLVLLDHPLRVWIRPLGTRRGTGSMPSSTGYPMSRRQGRRKTSQANSMAF